MAKFEPPEKFGPTQPNKLSKWKQCFERYRVAVKLNKESKDVQISSLMYSMGPKVEPTEQKLQMSQPNMTT